LAQERQVVVETVQLTKIFRDFWMRPKVKALDRVELQVRRGEIFGLLGPNGSGKSTLIKILLGLLFPSNGRAAIFGRDPRNIVIKDRIGYMPEESYLYRYLNAEETLDFYGHLFNLPRGERRHRIELLLDMVGLTSQRHRPIVEYSKGMARRIGLAQALINDPDLVFLDEPTTGLDPVGTREIKNLILELKKRGKTVFLCSHLLADVEDVCDRVAILYGGRVRRLGRMDDLLTVHAKTQITSDQLKAETINAVVALIAEMEGQGKEVAVEAPRDRLESFFLRVVEEARAARLETAGVTVGTSAASYFGGIAREEKADSLLNELLKTPTAIPREEEAAEEEVREQVVVLPASERPETRQKSILGELVKGSKLLPDAGEQAVPEEEQRPVVLPAGEEKPKETTTREVLGGLLGKKEPTDALDETDSTDSEQ
jgi:ABC-2 type transport system ATP-binding protein